MEGLCRARPCPRGRAAGHGPAPLRGAQGAVPKPPRSCRIGAAVEKTLVAVAGAARLGGGGEAPRAAQGCYYAWVITQPKQAPLLPQPRDRPPHRLGAAPQTSPGAATCPQPSTQDTWVQRPCPIAAWLGTSVSPRVVQNQRRCAGGQSTGVFFCKALLLSPTLLLRTPESR